MQRILGVDPGTRASGYAVVEQVGRQMRVVLSGTVRLGSKAKLSERLGRLQQALGEVIEQSAPAVVVVEGIFTHRNARSALLLGHARGVVLATAARAGLPVEAYPPATVKQAVTGHGRADKEQVQRMVQVLLSLSHDPGPDEADAMAIAVCHAMRCRLTASSAGTRGATMETA